MPSPFSRCFRALVSITLLLAIFQPATAQVSPAKPAAPPKKSPAPPPRPAKPQELVVPFWTLEPGWATHLELRNNLAQRRPRCHASSAYNPMAANFRFRQLSSARIGPATLICMRQQVL